MTQSPDHEPANGRRISPPRHRVPLATSPGGCSKPAASNQRLVVFSQCNNAEPYRAAQNKRFKELFASHPEIKFVIYDGQADSSKQISQIENAILQKPDLLIVAPFERNALTDVMGRAVSAGIPTICLERDIVKPNYTTYISSETSPSVAWPGSSSSIFSRRNTASRAGRSSNSPA